MKECFLECSDSFVLFKGNIIFDNMMLLFNDAKNLLLSKNILSFDFSAVNHCDSSALALVIELKKVAKTAGKTISFVNVPEQLFKIAKISGLMHLFDV